MKGEFLFGDLYLFDEAESKTLEENIRNGKPRFLVVNAPDEFLLEKLNEHEIISISADKGDVKKIMLRKR